MDDNFGHNVVKIGSKRTVPMLIYAYYNFEHNVVKIENRPQK